jgi:Fic family protein
MLEGMKNTYEHISFQPRWDAAGPMANLLGQCYAYIQAIKKTPIRPDYLQRMLRVSLNRGALATTAIEGNTLSESDVELIQSGKNLSPSKKYLQQEVQNILAAFNTIFDEMLENDRPRGVVSPQLIKEFHAMVGKDIGDAFAASPGVFRTSNVIVGSLYRPPSFPRVGEFIQKLCSWLEKQFHCKTGQGFDDAIIQAVVTHIYIAWIHPFGDGNGRTARLLEFYLLVRAGVPKVASHILSNHYNNTRGDYYRRLQEATATGELTNFLCYALQGFRDGLEELLEIIHTDQIDLIWTNYVHDVIDAQTEITKKVQERIRRLAYHMPGDKFLTKENVLVSHPGIIRHYQGLSGLTLQRDLDFLVRLDLLAQEKRRYRARKELLQMFMPDSATEIERNL